MYITKNLQFILTCFKLALTYSREEQREQSDVNAKYNEGLPKPPRFSEPRRFFRERSINKLIYHTSIL